MPLWLQKLVAAVAIIVGTSGVPIACSYLVIFLRKTGLKSARTRTRKRKRPTKVHSHLRNRSLRREI